MHNVLRPSADNLASHPDAIVDKMNEAAIAGFKGLHLDELHAYGFSDRHLHDWVTHIPLNTRMDLACYIKLPKNLVNHGETVDKSSGTPWCLTCYIPLLPF